MVCRASTGSVPFGIGTQGTIYRAHQTSRNRPVALKVLAGTAGRGTPVARFVREAEILARLDHPGIVRGYGVGEEHGFHHFAMEYVDGPDAATWLRRVGGQLPPAGALYLTLGCAAALAHAAGRSVVHRDVRPANRSGGAVKVTDWGLAKPTDADHALTGTHTGMGTLQYVAPEQVRDARRADHRSGIYALGGVLYELLTGRVPFPGSNWLEVLRAKERAAFPAARLLNPAVPRPCDVVLARMLAPDPDGRYSGYDDLIADLKGLAPTGDRPEGLALGGRPRAPEGPAAFVARMGAAPATQLAHAGRKLELDNGGWGKLTPSATPFAAMDRPPSGREPEGGPARIHLLW